MIVDFFIENFRSIKDEQHFSMETDISRRKLDNTFEVELADGSELRHASKLQLVKSAVVYGANASGKSNFIRAFAALRYLITKSDSFKVGASISCYEPFELEKGYETQPVKFSITFIATDLIKYANQE